MIDPNSAAVDHPTAVGSLRLEVGGGSLRRLELPRDRSESPPPNLRDARPEDASVLDAVRHQLDEYFEHRRRRFELPLAPEGTEFQRRVWSELEAIPFGETISYGELATRVGNPKASRAVGAANGQNPIAIIVPCHRVIGADGRLTGFGGGLPMKEWLLNWESPGLFTPDGIGDVQT
ncbi:MAG: methylated-DNA--[protein]-cysteine S-methyltransferase [Planctomycetota bacterium]